MDIAPPRAAGRVYTGNSASGNARVQYGDIHGNVTYNTYEVRQERIGIEASVSGLRSLTESIRTQLWTIPNKNGARPRIINDVWQEVTVSKSSLDTLDYKLSWLQSSPEQASLIKLDQLVILLANAVVLFDRLRTVLDKHIAADTDCDDDVSIIWPQLRDHNKAWKLQLDLMSRHTESETDLIALNLDNATNKLLAENADLKRRMDTFQIQLDQMSKQLTSSARTIRTTHDAPPEEQPEIDGDSLHSVASSFEDTLNSSWVYRRNQHRSEVMSIDTSLPRDYAWSEMSELTLANKSALSVLALPIELSELSHGSWYHDTVAQAPTLPTIAEEMIDLEEAEKMGREEWSRMSEAQLARLTQQMLLPRQMKRSPFLRPQVLYRRLRAPTIKTPPGPGAPYPKGTTSGEQRAIDIIGREDFKYYQVVWSALDPKNSLHITKETVPRLLRRLPPSFGLRIYDDRHSVHNLLKVATRIGPGITIATSNWRTLRDFCILGEILDKELQSMNVAEIRERKRRLRRLYAELMVTADPDRGVSFWSVLMILAMYRDETGTYLQDTIERFLRRRARLQRVDEQISREIVVGYFDMLYWRRQFLQHKRRKEAEAQALEMGKFHSSFEEEQESVEYATSEFERHTLKETEEEDQDLAAQQATEGAESTQSEDIKEQDT